MLKDIYHLFILLILLSFFNSSAQPLANSFKISDMSPYMEQYFTPFANAMSIGTTGGWYYTAKTHYKWGYDISFNGSTVKIPNTENKFLTNKLNMPGYYFRKYGDDTRNSDLITAPTIIFEGIEAPDIGTEFNSGFVEIKAIKGIGITKGGVAVLQGSFAPVDGTEILARFVPDMSSYVNQIVPEGTDLEFVKTSIWGLGAKHNLGQWIKKIKYQEKVHLAAIVSYSQFKVDVCGEAISITPDKFNGSSTILNDFDEETWDNQQFNMKFSSSNLLIICGVQLNDLHPYISIGMCSNNSYTKLAGNYPVISEINGIIQVSSYETNPISMKKQQFNYTFQSGASLTLGILVFHYQFTYQNYLMHTAGISFTYN